MDVNIHLSSWPNSNWKKIAIHSFNVPIYVESHLLLSTGTSTAFMYPVITNSTPLLKALFAAAFLDYTL